MPRTKQFDEDQVLQKAMQLFWDRGYYGTSISDLVTGLGISRASMYSTFGDKEALFDKAFSLYNQLNKGRVQDLFDSEPSVKKGFRLLMEGAILEDVQGPRPKGCLVVNTATELLPEDEKLRAKVEIHAQSFKKMFASYLQKGVAQGEISAHVELESLAAYLFTLYSGIKVMGKIQPNKGELLNILEQGLKILNV